MENNSNLIGTRGKLAANEKGTSYAIAKLAIEGVLNSIIFI